MQNLSGKILNYRVYIASLLTVNNVLGHVLRTTVPFSLVNASCFSNHYARDTETTARNSFRFLRTTRKKSECVIIS